MFKGFFGLLALGVVAVMVWDFTSSAHGPSEIKDIGTDISEFYGSLHGS